MRKCQKYFIWTSCGRHRISPDSLTMNRWSACAREMHKSNFSSEVLPARAIPIHSLTPWPSSTGKLNTPSREKKSMYVPTVYVSVSFNFPLSSCSDHFRPVFTARSCILRSSRNLPPIRSVLVSKHLEIDDHKCRIRLWTPVLDKCQHLTTIVIKVEISSRYFLTFYFSLLSICFENLTITTIDLAVYSTSNLTANTNIGLCSMLFVPSVLHEIRILPKESWFAESASSSPGWRRTSIFFKRECKSLVWRKRKSVEEIATRAISSIVLKMKELFISNKVFITIVSSVAITLK